MSTASTQSETANSPGTAEFAPVAAYGLLADCNSAALVDRDGSVSWLCLPRYDSPAVFSRILDPRAGHFSIRPTASYFNERRYLPGTLVIETTFSTPGGQVKIVDALAFAEGQRNHDLGMAAPHLLLRLVEGVEGEVELAQQAELASGGWPVAARHVAADERAVGLLVGDVLAQHLLPAAPGSSSS